MRNIFKRKTSATDPKPKKRVEESSAKSQKQKSKTTKKEDGLKAKSFYGDDEDLGYC